MDNMLEHLLFLARRFKKSDVRYVAIILLMELGVPTQYTGFEYLVKAIVIYVQDPDLVMKKGLYNLIAEQYGGGIDMPQIERAIRTVIESVWQKEESEAWDRYFATGKGCGKKKPANVEFISRLARTIELWMGCCDTYEQKNLDEEVTV